MENKNRTYKFLKISKGLALFREKWIYKTGREFKARDLKRCQMLLGGLDDIGSIAFINFLKKECEKPIDHIFSKLERRAEEKKRLRANRWIVAAEPKTGYDFYFNPLKHTHVFKRHPWDKKACQEYMDLYENPYEISSGLIALGLLKSLRDLIFWKRLKLSVKSEFGGLKLSLDPVGLRLNKFMIWRNALAIKKANLKKASMDQVWRLRIDYDGVKGLLDLKMEANERLRRVSDEGYKEDYRAKTREMSKELALKDLKLTQAVPFSVEHLIEHKWLPESSEAYRKKLSQVLKSYHKLDPTPADFTGKVDPLSLGKVRSDFKDRQIMLVKGCSSRIYSKGEYLLRLCQSGSGPANVIEKIPCDLKSQRQDFINFEMAIYNFEPFIELWHQQSIDASEQNPASNALAWVHHQQYIGARLLAAYIISVNLANNQEKMHWSKSELGLLLKDQTLDAFCLHEPVNAWSILQEPVLGEYLRKWDLAPFVDSKAGPDSEDEKLKWIEKQEFLYQLAVSMHKSSSVFDNALKLVRSGFDYLDLQEVMVQAQSVFERGEHNRTGIASEVKAVRSL